MKNEKVSIIIPAYNAINSIGNAIDSSLAQTYKNIEIIVVDDGSSDGTGNYVVKKYGNAVHVYIRRNSGVSAARNYGIKRSEGKYLMFLDADDELKNNSVERAVKCAKENDVDVVRFAVEERYFNRKKLIELGELAGSEIEIKSESQMDTLIDNFFGTSAKIKCLVMALLIKRSFLESNKISFNRKLYMMEDVVFYSDLFKASPKMYFLNEPLYIYNQNANSVTHDKNKIGRNIQGVIMANNEIEKRFPSNNSINTRHFLIVLDMISQKISMQNKEYIPIIKDLAHKACDSRGFASILRRLVISNKGRIFSVLIAMKAIKKKIKKKDRLICELG